MPDGLAPDPETQSALNIGFEIQMLGELPRWVMRFDDDNSQVPMVACLEATLLHARTMIEFLFGRRRADGSRHRKSSDESPARFRTQWQSKNPAAFDRWLDLIDKHLVHLSMNRLSTTSSAPGYFLTDIVYGLLDEIEDLVKALERDGSPQQVQFRAALAQARIQRMKDPRRWPNVQSPPP